MGKRLQVLGSSCIEGGDSRDLVFDKKSMTRAFKKKKS